MSFNKHTLTAMASPLHTLPLIALICTFYANCTQAENNDIYRQEPIFPIPQKIEFNQTRARLGEMLFFDTRMSRNNEISCASCHQLASGGDDNVAHGISMSAEQNVINTPSIFNVRYNFRQNWDGSTRTLQGQVDMAMNSIHAFDNTWDEVISTLVADPVITRDFNDAYPDGITQANIIDAIVEFEKTLITPNSRFDRYLRNESDSLSQEEIEGYQKFKELGCISCHQGVNIGGNLFQKFGVFYNYIAERGEISRADYGRMNTTQREMDKYVFKVPSLRNIAVTAPYLHDGSAETLEEAIDIMGKTQLGRTLTIDEVLLIKAFLNTLTGEYNNKLLDVQS
jgi:cytochrome c peroxidase